MGKQRYCQVGVGNRGLSMFGPHIHSEHGEYAELVAMCDSNSKRLASAKEKMETNVLAFTDFRVMLDEVPCDCVLVATPDFTHDEIICEALARGLDVVTEKPLTTDESKCRAILAAEQASKGRVRVAHNGRHLPYHVKLKNLIASGAVGDITSVELHWFLDTLHGADYYRRWHRRKENSGGLLIHKASHHFDLMNWLIGAWPERVYARGQRRFYGPTREERGERCLTCHHTSTCEFYLDLNANKRLRELYLNAEDADGYFRDRCVFDPEIDIEDTVQLLVDYENGVQLSYTLTSYSPFEGVNLSVNGNAGRLEFKRGTFVPDEHHNFAKRNLANSQMSPWKAAYGDRSLQDKHQIFVYPIYGDVHEYRVPVVRGRHGGSDIQLREMLFRPDTTDPLGQTAGSLDGAMAVLIGAAANRSMISGMPVTIRDLLGEEDLLRDRFAG